MKRLFCALFVGAWAVVGARASDTARRVVIYEGVTTEVAATAAPSKDLWISVDDLKRATGFVIKPQGVCREELCFPLPKNRKAEFVKKEGAVTWFNLSEFARLVKQPAAYDETHSAWYFGPRQGAASAFIETLEAPDFSLPDMNGKLHSLSDFRGKKVLLVTWASW